jgi:hypothetical protein
MGGMKKLAALIVVVVLALPALAWAVPKITGADVVDNSLTGADVDESTLNLPQADVGDVKLVFAVNMAVGDRFSIGTVAPDGSLTVGEILEISPNPNNPDTLLITYRRSDNGQVETGVDGKYSLFYVPTGQ